MKVNVNPSNQVEHFYWEPKWHGPKSNDCYTEKPQNCLKFSNCGICLNNKNKCIPGDAHGPLFKERCNGWVHSNYNDRYIFGEKVTTMTPSWGQFYPDYEYWAPQTGRAPLIY
jgi:hypothetical protein